MAGDTRVGSDADVLYDVADGIATITLNRPQARNALGLAANQRLHALWEEVDRDPAVRTVVLASTDCGTFCAGMDLKDAARLRAETGRDILDLLPDPFYRRMRAVRKPLIAAMTGHFTGAGMVLAMNADLRVGLAGTAGGITEARVGRGSPWAAPLAWMLPQPVLLEMVMTADAVPVERLHALGFVNHVEPTPQAVRERALALAHRIGANAPLSVLAGKASVQAALDLGCEAGFQRAVELHRPVYASQDAQEGPRAFLEKRAPRWLGA